MLKQTLDLVKEHVNHDLPHYSQIVGKAFHTVDPVFTRRRYSDFFWHCSSTVPGWLAQVILANAGAESIGSAKLVSLWQGVTYNPEIEDKVLFHARDEARHSRIFVNLAERTFEHAFQDNLLASVRSSLTQIDKTNLQKSETESIPENLLLDHLVQMNMGEIRTRLHMELLAPLINAFAPDDQKTWVQSTLNALAHDEVVHISYIALILEKMCECGDSRIVDQLYAERLADFNEFTISETESAVASFGGGNFPDLLEI